MITLILKFFANWWQEIAIGIIAGFIVYICASWYTQAGEIHRLNGLLDQYMIANEDYRTQIDHYNKLAEIQEKRLEGAKQIEANIIGTLAKDINKLRLQQVPKDCSGALEYSVKYKDDLKWPE